MGIKLRYNRPLLTDEELQALQRAQHEASLVEREQFLERKEAQKEAGHTIVPIEEPKYESSQVIVDRMRWSDTSGKFDNWSDEKIYDFALQNDPNLESTLFTPTNKQIRSVAIKQFSNLLKRDMSASALELFDSFAKTAPLPRTVESLMAGKPAKEVREGETSYFKKAKLRQAEKSRDEMDAYFNDNPDVNATREYMAGNRISDMKKGFWTQLMSGVLPSQAFIKGVGITTGAATYVATLAVTKNPLVAARNAGLAWASGEGLAGGTMEMSDYYSGGFRGLTTDKQISVDEFNETIAPMREQYEKEANDKGLWYDKEDRKSYTAKERLLRHVEDEFLVKEDGSIWKKGHSSEEADDILVLPSKFVGVTNGAFEMISTSAAYKGVTGRDLTSLLGLKWYAKTTDKLATIARRIPKRPGVVNRLRRHGPEFLYNTTIQAAAEGMEEVLQGLNTEFVGQMTWNDEPWNYGFDDIAEAFVGGALGSTITGAHLPMQYVLGANYKIQNMKIRGMAPRGEGWQFYVEQNKKTNKYEVKYRNAKYETNIKTGEKELAVSEGTMSPEDAAFAGKDFEQKSEFDTFQEAFRHVEGYTAAQNIQDEKFAAWNGQGYVDAEVRVESITEDGKDIYLVNVYNKKGEKIWTADSFNSRRKANKQKFTIEQNVNTITKWSKKYGGPETLAEDFDVKRFEREDNTGGTTNELVKSYTPESINLINTKGAVNIGIKAFMSETFEEKDEDDIAVLLIDEGLLENPQMIKDFITSDPQNKNIFRHGPEKIKEQYETLFEEDAGWIDEIVGPPVTPTPGAVVTPEAKITPEAVVTPEKVIPPTVEPPVGAPVGKPRKSPVEGMDVGQIEQYIAKQQKIVDKGKPETMDVVAAKNRIKIAKKRLVEIKKAPEEVIEGVPEVGKPPVEAVVEEVEEKVFKPTDKIKVTIKGKTKTITKVLAEKQLEREKVGLTFLEDVVSIEDPTADFVEEVSIEDALKRKRENKDVKILTTEASEAIEKILGLEEALGIKEKKEPPKARIEISKVEREVLEVKDRKKELTSRLDMLSEKFKGRIKYKIFDTQDDNVLRLKDEQGVPESAEAWYNPNNKTIYAISDMAALSAPFHEFAHPFVEEIRINNPKLYDNLYKDIVDTKEGQQLLEQVSLKYTESNIDFNTDSDAFKDEIIVFSLEKLTDNRYTPQSKFMRTVRRIWDSILEFIFGKSFMNNIYASELSPNTTLNDLAKILADDKGRYAISIEETAEFSSIMDVVNDVVQDNTDDRDLIGNISSILTDGFLAGSNTLWNLTSDIENRIVSAVSKKKDIPKVISSFVDEISKRYNIDTGKYKDDIFVAEYQPISEAKNVIVDGIKSFVESFLPKGKKLPKGIMDKLQNVFTEIEGRIQFRYKLIDNVLSKKLDSKEMINIRDLPVKIGVKGSNEVKFIQAFIDEHWFKNFPDKKSALAAEIIPEYQEWADNYFPIYSSRVGGYETSLSYPALFDMNKVNVESVYSVMFHNGTIFRGTKHDKYEFTGPGVTERGNGYGWYIVLKLSNGDIFLHEYQSDILPELKKALKSLKEDKETGEIEPKTKLDIVKAWKIKSIETVQKTAKDAVVNSLDLKSLNSRVISKGIKADRLKVDFVDIKRKYSRKDLKYYLKKNPFIATNTTWDSMPELIEQIASSMNSAIFQYNEANNTRFQDEVSLITLVNDIIDNDLVISNTGNKLKTHYEEIAANIIIEEKHLAGPPAVENYRVVLDITKNNVFLKVGKALLFEGSQKYKDVTSFLRFYYKNQGLFFGDNLHILSVLEDNGFVDNYLYKVFKNELNNYEKNLYSIGVDTSIYLGGALESILLGISNPLSIVDSKIKKGESIDKKSQNSIERVMSDITGQNVNLTNKLIPLQREGAKTSFILDKINPDKTDKAIDNFSELFPIFIKRYTKEYMWSMLKNNTAFDAIKYAGLKDYINEEGEIDSNFINDIYENAINSSEVEQALRIDKHWFTTLILHSFMHSRHIVGNNKIYLSTGEANTLIQGNGAASGLYSEGGVWRKSLDKLAIKHGVKVKIVQPDFAKAPLIEITLPEKGNLNPPRFKIKLDESADDKFVPHSEEQIALNIKRKLSYFDNYRTMSRDFVVNLLNDSWAHMDKIAKERYGRLGRVDLQDFTAAMIDVLPEEIHDFYTSWVEDKFQSAKDRAAKLKSTDTGARYSWLDAEDILNEAIDITDEPGISEGLNDLIEKGTPNEKELGQNERLYFVELKMNIIEQQFRRIRAATRQYDTFNSWVNYVLPNILKRISKVSIRTTNGLKKYYSRIRSTLKTNGDIKVIDGKKIGVPNQRNNLVLKKRIKRDKEGFITGKSEIEIEVKGPKNIVTGTSNNQYEKMTLYERNVAKNVFTFIKGKDVLELRAKKDTDGNFVFDRTGAKKKEWTVSYNFLQQDEYKLLSDQLKVKDMAIAFVRGTDDTIGLVRVKPEHKEAAKDAVAYWDSQDAYLGNTLSEIERRKENFLEGDTQDRAIEIAVYEAMKSVWPKYLLDPKGGANVYKRIKIPFTPVTISHEMPSFRVVKFNPDDVMFVYGNNEPFSPIKVIKGLGKVYIGDGNSLTSKDMFDMFNKSHGLAKGTSKAKTVIYHKDGDNVIAIKHEHVMPKKGWKITDKAGNTLFTIDRARNIRDADGNIAHMLLTDDEAKIWDFSETDKELPGTSVGFTKYDETAPKYVKHGIQWYNHVYDRGIFDIYGDNYLPIAENNIRNLYRLSIHGLKKGPSENIGEFLGKFTGGEGNVGYIPSVIELAKLGAGLHPSITGHLNLVLQNRLMIPALHFDKSNGSRYEIAMDVTGELNENEISLSKHNSRMVLQAYADFYNISLSDANSLPIEEINGWLLENEVEVLVSRYPIPHAGGVYVARVKSLHMRKGLADLNHIDIKKKLEGDGDGDEVQIELLTPEVLSAYKTFIRSLDVKAVNLDKFVSKRVYDTSNKNERLELMYKSTIGEKSIGEIANIQAVYGILANAYSHINASGLNIRIKQPNEIIEWDVFYDGKRGWKGPVSEFLRIYLQGAVDNGQYGVLGEWGYGPGATFMDPSGQEKIWMMLFETDIEGIRRPLNPNNAGDLHNIFRKGLREVINIHKKAAYIRKGEDFNTGPYNLVTEISKSNEYYEMMRDNRTGLRDKLNEMGISVIMNEDSALVPVEELAVLPARILDEMDAKHNLFGYDVSPFSITDRVHKNAHVEAIEYMDARITDALRIALERDGRVGDSAYAAEERRKGAIYTRQMGNKFYQLLTGIKDLDSKTMDRNEDFIAFKEEFNGKFEQLSNTARVVATYTFLKGYLRMSNKVDKFHKTNFPRAMPPVSGTKGEYTLLSPAIMKTFFKAYNNSVTVNRNADNVVKLPGGKTILQAMKDACA